MSRTEYTIPTKEEKSLLKKLEPRQEAEALRIKRYLEMIDLYGNRFSP